MSVARFSLLRHPCLAHLAELLLLRLNLLAQRKTQRGWGNPLPTSFSYGPSREQSSNMVFTPSLRHTAVGSVTRVTLAICSARDSLISQNLRTMCERRSSSQCAGDHNRLGNFSLRRARLFGSLTM